MEIPNITCPYVGLTPYTEDQSDFFFGREKETRLIASKLYAARLTLLYGASGVGKSSVLRAGVTHSLRQEGAVVVYFSAWQSDPLSGLRAAIANEAARIKPAPEAPEFLRVSNLGDCLRSAAARVGDLMIILDQFEEYFLYHPRDDESDSFAAEFAKAINRDDVPASFLISIREDAYTKLDRFKGRIPNLFANYAHLDHLSVDAARAAIEKPIEKYNSSQTGTDRQVKIEPVLVDAVLDQVRTGQVVIGETGRGVVAGGTAETKIETPYLQLVMTRLWDEEAQLGSRTLRLETLNQLGGAKQIVRTHLDQLISRFSADEQEISARLFRVLVTPTGAKIAHTIDDLASYAERPVEQISPVLKTMSDARVIRPVAPPIDQPTATRYEIFHDVLGSAVLDWRRRYLEKQAQEQAKREEQKRQEQARRAERERRTRILVRVSISLGVLLLLIFGVLTLYAFQQSIAAGVARGQAISERDVAATAKADAIIQRDAAAMSESNAMQAKSTAIFLQNVATSRQIAASAVGTLETDPELSLLLAIQAFTASETHEAEDALRQAVNKSPGRFLVQPGWGTVTCAVFSPDGKQIVAGTSYGDVQIWDVMSGRSFGRVGQHENSVTSVSFSPNGRQIVTASKDGTARVWSSGITAENEWEPIKPQIILQGHTQQVVSAVFSPDGKQIATASYDGTARTWDVASGHEVTTFRGHTREVMSVSYNPDGKQIVTASLDGTARVWDVFTGRESTVLRGHSGEVFSASYNPDGKTIVTASRDHSARVWDVITGSELRILAGHQLDVMVAIYSPDGKQILTADRGGMTRTWDATTGRALAAWRGHSDVITSVGYSPDGKRIVTTSQDRTLRVWDVTVAQGFMVLGDYTEPAWRVAYRSDGKQIATAGFGGTVRIWEAMTGRELGVLVGHTREVLSVMFSPDGKQIVTASADQTARVWDAMTGRELIVLRGHAGEVIAASFSPDGKQIVTASSDQTARVWEATSGSEQVVLRGHTAGIRSATYSSDGKSILTAGDDRTARIWDATTGREQTVLRGHTGSVTEAIYSPDGKKIITASYDNTVRIWDVMTGRALNILRVASSMYSLSFSPDGKRFVTAGYYGPARVWDVESGEEVATLYGNVEDSLSAVYSPDGKQILVPYRDGTALVHFANARDLVVWTRSLGLRNLTCEEKSKYLYAPACPTATQTSTPSVTPTQANLTPPTTFQATPPASPTYRSLPTWTPAPTTKLPTLTPIATATPVPTWTATPTTAPPTAGPSPTATATGSTATAFITMFNLMFVPPSVNILRGTTVRWTNSDGVNHTVRSGVPGAPTSLFNSGTIASGHTFQFTFNDAGTFPFFSELDSGMTGTITVQ